MAVRPFLRWPDPRLRTPAEPVVAVDDAARAVWEDMLDSMYAMPGVGLAAPQIGAMLRLAVVDCSEVGRAPIRMANPELLWASDETETRREGSPNLPGLWEPVERPARVRMRWLDETGTAVERELDGLWATSAQHQLDHLDGRVFIDRLKPVKRRMALERLKKLERRAKRET